MTLPLPLHERPGHPCKAESADPQSPKVMEAGCVECGAALASPSDAICQTCLTTAASVRRTSEMNAELPDDVREMLKLKGMI